MKLRWPCWSAWKTTSRLCKPKLPRYRSGAAMPATTWWSTVALLFPGDPICTVSKPYRALTSNWRLISVLILKMLLSPDLFDQVLDPSKSNTPPRASLQFNAAPWQPRDTTTNVSGISVDARSCSGVGGVPTLTRKGDQAPSLPRLETAGERVSRWKTINGNFSHWDGMDIPSRFFTYNSPLGSTTTGAG